MASPDSQRVEIAGRNLLVSSMLLGGVEVARPERDRGVDLVAYLDLDAEGSFVACPVQMKASTAKSFGVFRKYEKFSRMLFAFVWNVDDMKNVEMFCLTWWEAIEVVHRMGWAATESWETGGGYSTTRPSGRLLDMLEPHRMQPDRWKAKVKAVGTGSVAQPVPAPDAPFALVFDFAMTFDGYAEFGEALANLGMNAERHWNEHQTVSGDERDTRAALFYKMRELRFSGYGPSDADDRYLAALLDRLRRLSS